MAQYNYGGNPPGAAPQYQYAQNQYGQTAAPPAYAGGYDNVQKPPAPFVRMDSVSKLENLKKVAMKYELQGGAISKLRKLESYDIVVIADDSGSMNNPAHAPPANDPFAKVETRWNELQQRVLEICEIACCLDQDGIDIYFLNRPPVYNVHDTDMARACFIEPPNGYTPLSKAYNQVLREKLANSENKVLIIIATDGEPNAQDGNGTWRRDVNGFSQLLATRGGYAPTRCPTSIMACTDADDEVGWLNTLDDKIQSLDVIDDYLAERQEVKTAQGAAFPFSKGDYVVKTMLGALDPLYDNLDEEAMTDAQLSEYTGRPLSELGDIIAQRPSKKSQEGGCVCHIM